MPGQEPSQGPTPGQRPGMPRALLGDADRERLTGLLREHYALGRLDLEELSRRVGIVLAAEYADEAAATVTDLPPLGDPASGSTGVPGAPIGQRRRHAQAVTPAPGWVPTAERFRDPSTKKIMRVWVDPADRSRHYVPDSGD
ncbi:MAG TPA: DUF1707 domain-containing protein [Streptosporangiaceae bacterium]